MRIAISLFGILLAFTAASFGTLSTPEGKILHGKYLASGSASIAAVTVQYLPSTVHMNSHGRVRGYVTRVVSSGGVVLQQSVVVLRGNASAFKMRKKKGNFTADGVLRLGDGTVFRGSFNGLTDQRLSRYFRGKIKGQKNSRFLLRSK